MLHWRDMKAAIPWDRRWGSCAACGAWSRGASGAGWRRTCTPGSRLRDTDTRTRTGRCPASPGSSRSTGGSSAGRSVNNNTWWMSQPATGTELHSLVSVLSDRISRGRVIISRKFIELVESGCWNVCWGTSHGVNNTSTLAPATFGVRSGMVGAEETVWTRRFWM